MPIAKYTPRVIIVATFSLAVCNNAAAQTIAEDTIQYDTTVFPQETKYISKVLTTGDFHGDEVWKGADKAKWFGLFQNKTGFYLAQTQVKTKKVNDPILDGDNKNIKTGWNVQTTIKDTSIILVSGLNFLANHKVKQAVLSKQEILPGDTVRFNYGGTAYILYATGGKEKEANSEWVKIWNYKLFLTAKKKNKTITELLVAQPNFNDRMITILFAGDIDGDGMPDLIIDT